MLWLIAVALFGSGSWMLAQSVTAADLTHPDLVNVAVSPDGVTAKDGCGKKQTIQAAPQELPNADPNSTILD
jgi:hypothetical protein